MTLTDSQPHVEGQGRTSSVARAVHAAHDHLFKEAGLDPAHAYDEIIRVLAALTHLRRSGVLLNERSLADTIEHHASAVLDELAAGTELAVAFGRPSVEDPILDRLVEILSTLDLESSMGDSDPFGIIFQQVVTSTFRASLGAYFTPMPIAAFMAEAIDPQEGELVVDPSAGSGGLLTSAARAAAENGARIRVGALDINPRMVLTEALNFYLSGIDVESLVLGDGLVDAPCEPGEADIVLANPPFAGHERRPEVLAKYRTALHNGSVRSLNKTIPFVERIITLLRPGGRMALVLPISIFNAEESSFVELRRLLFEQCQIDAVIGLPPVAFEHTDCGIAGGLLFATRRKTPPKKYEILIAQADAVGYDSIGYPIEQDDLPTLLAEYRRGSGDRWVPSDMISAGERIDPHWWSPASRSLREAIDKGRHLVPLTDACRVVRRPLDRRQSPDAVIEYFEVRDTDPEFGHIVKSHEIRGADLRRKGRIKQIVRTGDVLLPNHRDSLTSKASGGGGRSAVLVSEAFDGLATTDRFIVLEPLIDANVLIAILNAPAVRAQLVMQSRGSASLDIRESVLSSVMIPDVRSMPSHVVEDVSRAMAAFRGLKDTIEEERLKVQDLVASLSIGITATN